MWKYPFNEKSNFLSEHLALKYSHCILLFCIIQSALGSANIYILNLQLSITHCGAFQWANGRRKYADV